MVEFSTIMSREIRNFYKVAEALVYAGNVLEKYTEDGLKHLHEKICRRIPGHFGRCNARCSQKFGKDVKRWCGSCSKWKKELESASRQNWKFQRIDWRQYESWKWEEGYRNIAPVFVGHVYSHDVTKIKFNDLSTALSVMDNCNEFNISQTLIHKLRDVRNEQFAHNTLMEVSDQRFSKVFNILGVLFRDPSLNNYIDSDKCLDKLEYIKNNDTLETSLEQIKNELKQIRVQGNAKSVEISDAVHPGNNSVKQQKDCYTRTLMLIKFIILICTPVVCILLVCWIMDFNPIDYEQQTPTFVFPKRQKKLLA